MTTDNIIDLYNLACGGLFVWALAATLALWDERREREADFQRTTKIAEIERLTKKVATLEGELSALRANSSKQR